MFKHLQKMRSLKHLYSRIQYINISISSNPTNEHL